MKQKFKVEHIEISKNKFFFNADIIYGVGYYTTDVNMVSIRYHFDVNKKELTLFDVDKQPEPIKITILFDDIKLQRKEKLKKLNEK